MAKHTGVLLCNLGTPTAPTPVAVRQFLNAFLGDPRVVELPRIPWTLLRKILIPLRAKRVVKSYQAIWTEQGSPLLVNTLALAAALNKSLAHHLTVVPAMRYSEPSIEAGLQHLLSIKVDHIIILPLFPQYSAATTASIFDVVSESLRQQRFIPSLHFISGYFDHPAYIQALKVQIMQHLQLHGMPDQFILSFHGLPQTMVDQGDPYQQHCQQTAAKLAAACGWRPQQWQLTFQSRVGPKSWLQPYTDLALKQLPSSGVKNIAVICPGFAIDCLETLEEIAILNRAYFLQAGGKQFTYIPALNQHPSQIELLTQLILAAKPQQIESKLNNTAMELSINPYS